MNDNLGRVFGALAGLAALWIVVYWWWEPGASQPRISYGQQAPAVPAAKEPTPTIKEPPPEPAKPAPAPAEPPKAAEAPKVVVIPPRFRDYVIKHGDTLEAIAERELGSRALVNVLRSANALMDPEHLKEGRTIRIPVDPTNIQGKPVVEQTPVKADAAPTAPPAPAAPAPTADPATETRQYTVKPGETLSEIAKAQYGSTKYTDLIFEANRDQLESPDSLREGQKLKLPPKPKN
jgi:5'-nucleotidase